VDVFYVLGVFCRFFMFFLSYKVIRSSIYKIEIAISHDFQRLFAFILNFYAFNVFPS
jgi:hypothetical protein